jgi:hypothetical protein
MNDLVNKPKHYQSFEIEPIDILRFAPFCLGNCLKYILRAEYKGTPELDYKKADKYLTWCSEEHLLDQYEPYYKFIDNYGLILKKHRVLNFLNLYNTKEFLKSIEDFLILKLGKTEEYRNRNNYKD